MHPDVRSDGNDVRSDGKAMVARARDPVRVNAKVGESFTSAIHR
jgi:hypothetical protein